ncbi:MAG TPA: cytochrome c biogenesis protein CcdA [Acidimicrobiales bacterium]|nr:cytochrome c biogenesis protein CcdA [Acidimicrobiales bacterium]
MLLAVSSGPTGWVVAFAAGMFSFLSPCVLPLVPGYLSLMSGVGTAELAGTTATRVDPRRVLRSTLLFVGGFTVVFVAFGATASAIGQVLIDHQLGLNRIAGAAIMVMALFLAGVVRPVWMERERRLEALPSRLGNWAPPIMGMAFAFGWTPCIGPVLGGVLGYAAAGSTLTQGVLLLLFYSLGLGIPFVAAGLAFDRLTGAFAWAKRHFRSINLVSAALLFVFGYLLFTNQVTRMSTWMLQFMERTGLDFIARI